MRGSARSRVATVSALALLASGLPAVTSSGQVARATANANVHLSSSVATSTSAPVLGLSFTADKADVTPGDAITYTSRLTNTGSEWQQTGTITAQATSASDAVVASWYDELDYRDSANRWQPVATYASVRTGYTPKDAGAAKGGLTVTATPRAATGVTYLSSGDLVLGAVIGAGKTGSWSFTGSVVLSPAQITTLTKSSSAVRQTIHVEVTPRNSSAAQPASDTQSLRNPLQAGTSATVTNASVSVTLPNAAKLTVDKKTVAGLASIAPGATVVVSSTYSVPVPGVEKTGESDGVYLARLHALVGLSLSATASAQGTASGAPSCGGGDPGHHYGGGNVNGDNHSGHQDQTQPPATPANTVATGLRTVASTEHLPVLSLTKSGPAAADAGSTATYAMTAANAGDAAASAVAVVDTLPDGSKPAVSGFAATLASGGTATGSASYPIPASQPEGSLADTATLTWTDARHNPYGPVNSSFTTTVKSSYAGAALSLTPSTAGPLVVGTSQRLTASLTSATGAVMPGKSVTVTVTGANPQTQTATTDAFGSVTLTYRGTAAGDDTVQAKVVGASIASNTATVGWTKPQSPVSMTTVAGNFYPASPSDQAFTATPASTAVFGEQFPNIAFNPPSGAVPSNITGVGPTTTPFTDVTTDVSGHGAGKLVAAGNGHAAYSGDLRAFDAALTSTLVVARAGNITFKVVHSGGAFVGVGGGAVSVSGAPSSAASSAMSSWPVVGGSGSAALDRTDTFTVAFPAAGSYPLEIDYFSTGDVRASLVLSVVDYATADGKPPALSVYTGYADTEDPAGTSTFPAPFFGSPGTSFVGSDGPYDTGLIRLDNHTDSAVPVSSLTVDIGKKHYDPWASSSLSVPPQGTLMLGSTDGENFDTSDPNAGATSADPTSFKVSNFVTGIYTYFSVGPVGLAMDPAGDFYFTDYASGQLFRIPAGGDANNPQAIGSSFGIGLAGLAFSPSGRLYVVQQNSNQLLEVDPNDGHVIRSVVSLPSGTTPTALALDPLTGDLFISSPGILRVHGYEDANPTVTPYSDLTGFDGLTFAPDGTLYAMKTPDNILRIDGTDKAQPAAAALVAHVPNPDGVGILTSLTSPDNPSLLVNRNDGTITKVDTATSPPTLTDIYTGGTRGDLVATGSDGCLYATQTYSILKITAADGSCPFQAVVCTKVSTVPRVNLPKANGAAGYDDKQLTLTDGGVDGDHCGNRNESGDWTQIGGPTGLTHPIPPAGSLTLSPEKATSAVVGREHPYTVTAMDADGNPAAGLSVDVSISGASTGGVLKHVTAVTGADGSATVEYSSPRAGTDTFNATALISAARVVSNSATTTWTVPDLPPAPTPTPTPSASASPTPTPTATSPGGGGGSGSGVPPSVVGVSPADGARILVPTPVSAAFTAPDGETITTWSVAVTSAAGANISIAKGTGQPPATLGTLDPTLLADGQYNLVLTADASGGGEQVISSSVVIDGNLKLGRFAATWHDTDASMGSTSLGILRSYDSTVKSSGDFGFGWSMSTSGIKVSTNGPLGESGWSSYDASCVFSICTTGYKTAKPHVVVVTFPDGHIESFDFTPQGGQGDYWLAFARFTARAGTTSTLTPVGDDNILDQGDGNLYDEESGDPYNPTQFLLTTHDGSKLLLDTTIGLQSFTNLAGITYTFTPTGITSSAGGNTAVFTRDSSHRITDIKADGTTHYSYSGAGDLASMTDPAGAVTTFSYDGQHDLLSVNGPGNVPLRTMHYDASGRLTSVTDADGNSTAIADDVVARTQVIKDPNGKLTTTLHLDDLGDVLSTTAVGDGQTRTSSATYDVFGHQLSTTDSLLRTTSRTYDDAGNVLSFQDTGHHTRSIAYDPSGQPLMTTDATGGVQHFGYDGSGNLTDFTDANGHIMHFGYDAAGRVASKADATAGTTYYLYDDAGRLSSMQDPLGRTTHYTYDAAGHPASITDADGRTSHTTYDSDGRLLNSTDAAGHATVNHYDALGHPSDMVDPLGKKTSYVYTAAGLLASSADPDARQTQYQHDAAGHVTAVIDSALEETDNAYDAFGELSSVTDPLLRTTGYGYDLAGQRTSTTAANHKTTSYTYSDAGDRTDVTDPLGHTTHTVFDAMHRPTDVTDADLRTTHTDYYPGGQVKQILDPAQKATKFSYDDANRLATVVDPLQEKTQYFYDAAGQLSSEVDPSGVTTAYTYTGVGKPDQVTDGLMRVTKAHYDLSGNLDKVTSSSGRVVNLGYDLDNRPTSSSDVLGDTTGRAYDDAGLLQSTTDGRGKVTSYGYDTAGRLHTITDPMHGQVVLDYDAAGQQTKVTDPSGVSHTYGYDLLGNQTKVTDALGHSQLWLFDDAGRLMTATNARNQVTSYSYDKANQLTAMSSPDGAVSQGFDLLGDRTSLTDSTGTSTYGYDAVGRMTSATTPAGSVAYGYDPAGRRTDVTTAGAHVGYSYDASGALGSVVDASGTTSMGYNPDGALASVTRPNGVVSAYGYDLAGRLTSIHADHGATPVAHFDYTLDRAGNRTAVTGPDGSQSFLLDDNGRLANASGSGAASLSYGYDGAGNRTSVTSGSTTTGYSYDAAGRLSKVGSASVSTDADGNVTAVGADSYAYNTADALTAATVGGKAATYAVNADGQRVAVTAGGSTSKLVLDVASDLPAVLAETGHRYTRDTAGGLLADTTSGGTSYPVTDGQGTVRAVTDASGSTTGTASYDPYGVIRSTTGTASSFGYTGAVTDVGGNVNLQAREYAPAYGQFLQSDTFTVGGAGTTGFNHYTYTGDNPTTQIDPSGHFSLGEVDVSEAISNTLNSIRTASAQFLLRTGLRQMARTFINIVINRIRGCFASAAEDVATGAAERFAGTAAGTAAGGGSASDSLGAGASAAADPTELVNDALAGEISCAVTPEPAPAGQVPYGSTPLSQAVQQQRITLNDKGGNYAAALLDDGTIAIGRSGLNKHAEEALLEAVFGKIVSLYSERQPCAAKCEGLVQGLDVTWTWLWNPADVRKASNASLQAAVKELFQ